MTPFDALRIVHIGCGTVGLVTMLVPLIARKGSPVHRRFGRVFAWSMALCGGAGMAMGLAWMLAPLSFVLPEAAAGKRAAGLFFMALGLLLLGSVQQMTGALARKHRPMPEPSLLEVGVPLLSVAVGVATVLVGLAMGSWLHIGFGALTAANSVSNLNFVRTPLATPRAWWYQHMQGAMVAMISGITAFALFGGQRWFAAVVPANWAWLLWILPTLVITPLFGWWTRTWRRRFGELPAVR